MEAQVGTLRDLIDVQARQRPDVTFLVMPETRYALTYSGLRDHATAVSQELLRGGLKPGDKVAFLLDNGLFTAQIFLGAIYGGFVAVPLNVRAGVAQLSFTLDHCDANIVFVSDSYKDLLTEVLSNIRRPIRVVPVDVDVGLPASEPTAAAAPPPAPDAPALLMYTSGSTGRPKAAVHSHRSVLAGARNSVAAHQLTAADRSLLVLPLYHINAECVTLIPALLSGGSVVIPHRFSVRQFWDWIDEYRCTWSALVPTIISQLIDWQDPRAAGRAAAFQRLRFLRSSSAPLAPSLHREFVDKFKLLLLQAMGSTEAGNIFSNPLPPGANKIGSPGLPWGFETRIIDRAGVDVPPGQPGELLVRGPALMNGYYKDPEGTAAAVDAAGWMHTGDLACRDPDGYFFIVGRSKELIIKAGMNIAPRQIDDVLEAHPAVLEAAVVGVSDRYVGEDLVAFAVLRAGQTCDERDLLAFCEQRLGKFKTPTRIHFLAELPKGPSGKVQRLRLLDSSGQPLVPASASAAYHAPPECLSASERAPTAAPASIEDRLAAVWADLLKVPHVDPGHNFFELGGHSLLAIECLSRLRGRLPIALSLSDFFEHPTVAQQAALVRQRLGSNGHGPPSPDLSTAAWERLLLAQLSPAAAPDALPPRNRALPCPLSPAQRRLWFFEQLLPGTPLYNECEAVRLRGELQTDALERALNVVVARHEVLRLTVDTSADLPRAVVHPSWPLRVKRIDLSGLPEHERRTRIERLLVDEPRRPYRLQEEPGIRATLLCLGPREHVFIVMMHHMLCDWASIGILWRELSAAYRAFSRGDALALAPLPLQYGDYAAWQDRQQDAADYAGDLAYWTQTLRDAPEPLELPSDRPRPRTNSYAGARRRFRLSGPLVGQLRALGRREKTSLFNVFAAAFNLLLARYAGKDDISLLLPIADRDRQELRSMMGFMLHTHVLRTRVAPDLTFAQLMARVQQQMLALYSHRAVPFDRVVRQLRPGRNLSYAPLAQVMLIWRDREQEPAYIGLDGLAVESVLAESRIAKFDLTFFVTDGGDAIWLEIEYSTDLFDDARIDRMAGHVQTLLAAAVADPRRTLADLPLLTDGEQRTVVEWNQTQHDYPADRCLHELIAAQASRTPDAPAVSCGRDSLTYRQLHERAAALALRLRGLGIGPDKLVGVFVERSLDMMVGLLAILQAGGAYVPLDPAFPQERLALVAQDARLAAVVTQPSLVGRLSAILAPAHASNGGAAPPVVCVESPAHGGAVQPPATPPAEVQPDDLAYVLYTSGSTGRPKGVPIPHRALVNCLVSMSREPGFGASDILLAVTTLSFDIAGLELWLPLLCGGRVVIALAADAADGKRLAPLLTRSRATVMQATPATWRLLLDAGWKGSPGLKILCGGEAWSQDLARRLLPCCGSLWNMYGPTETTIWSAVSKVQASAPPLVGLPIANTQFHVLDATMHPVPIGVPGELLIGGHSVARGYWNRPDLTAQKFIPDPFHPEPGARLYRTGDLVRRRPDGPLEFLGRIDHQVKIRGYRIELGEIENALLQCPSVRQAVVVADRTTAEDARLVAYCASDDPPTPAALRRHLQRTLPDYMIPSFFIILAALPLTPNGKVDRAALPRPGAQTPAAAVQPPESDTEMALARLWCATLGVERVGLNDNFFETGGHSLLAARIVLQIGVTFGVEFPLRCMFEYPTLSGQAEQIDIRLWTRHASRNAGARAGASFVEGSL